PPTLTEWEVESTLETRFYDADYISGNASLEAAGFKDLDGDGWREYDANSNGEWDANVDLDDNDPLLVINIMASTGFDIAIVTSEVLRDGLAKMGVRSRVEEVDWPEPYWLKVSTGDYWVACYELTFKPTFLPPKALYTDYHSDGEWNPVLHRFYNTTIDSVLDKMLAATAVTDIKKYSREAAQLLAYEQPEIPIYSPLTINAYRNDKFEGFLEFAGRGTASTANPYVATKVHLKESKAGLYGGMLTYSAMDDISNRNPFRFPDLIGVRAFIENSIYGGLWQPDPTTWDPIPNLAWNWEIEPTTAQVVAGIQAGQKFTFYLYKNATWHDGQPVTSKDVKFSFELPRNYYYPDVFYVPEDINDIYRIDTPDNYTVELYVNRTDIFAWTDITSYNRILPQHIWKDVENITAFEPTDAQVIGFGPYMWNGRVPGQYVSLLRHENWHFAVRDEAGPSTTSSQESTTSKGAYGFEIVFAVVGIALIYINRRRKWI
ncbi:MAG: ABC transporter substrate-binding protein, partial [Promethearchaeota archaeon]